MADISLPTLSHRPSLLVRAAQAFHAFALKQEARRTQTALDTLDDHMLRDIGLGRHEIASAVDAATRLSIQDLKRGSLI